jgi:hypothetical protein
MSLLPSNDNEMTKNTLTGLSDVPSTIKDVARLAGVSTTTVSRVVNNANNVSGKTKARVLNAISSLKYHPNAFAAELRRARGNTPRRCGNHVPALVRKRAKVISSPGLDLQNSRQKKGRLHLLKDEYSQMRRLIANLSKDLEELRSITDQY